MAFGESVACRALALLMTTGRFRHRERIQSMKMITGELASGQTVPTPEITCWQPNQPACDIGVIIFPGGGYGKLAPHEGEGYAMRLCQAGITCFVVKYRLGSEGFRHPAMLEDAFAAIRTIRAHAADLNLHPNKIGVMGSSAGGHLAAHTLVAWHAYPSDVSLRPDFGILCYPVITSDPTHTHRGSMQNLLGNAPTETQLHAVSCEKLVSANTPPCFLWHTGDDEAVPMENSLLFAQALRANRVPFELHIYPHGRHGLGLDTPFDWATPCIHWMKSLLH